MNDTIETLLESLNDYTIQSEQILQEGSDSIDRILKLQSRLSGNANCSGYKLSENDKHLIEQAKRITATTAHRVYTYPNINRERVYDIHAGCNIDFVMEKIIYHINHPGGDFDSKKINEEAICKTFKKLTKSSYTSKYMPINEFKNNYKSFAFGTFRKKLVTPKPTVIAKLFDKSPTIISYINNKLIFEHINNLKPYYKEIQVEFNKHAKDNPNRHISLNGYMACLDVAMNNTLIMYKAIRQTFYDLNTEYRYVFGELIKIDRELRHLNESIDFSTDELFTNIKLLNESINDDLYYEQLLTESPTDTSSKLSDKSKSLLDSVISIFKNESALRDVKANDIKDLITKSGIIAKLDSDKISNIDSVVRLYSNMVNIIDMNAFISKLDNKIDFCKTQFNELINNREQLIRVSKLDVLRGLLSDTTFWVDAPEENSDTVTNIIADSIKEKLFGNPVTGKLNNLNPIFDNIVNIPDYLVKINNHIKKFNDMVVELVITNTNTNTLELITKNLISAYMAYSIILSCIFANLYKFEDASIKLVQDLYEDII